MKGCTLPYFMKKAYEDKNPIERMKYTVTSIISSAYYMNLFLKPVLISANIVEPSNRRDSTRILCRWNINLLRTNFPSPSDQLFFSVWTREYLSLLWVLCI